MFTGGIIAVRLFSSVEAFDRSKYFHSNTCISVFSVVAQFLAFN